MFLSDLCIKRPVFATVLSLIVLLIGLISYSRLPVREYPNIDEPVVTVQTTYLGASAEIMESQVTKPLEDSLSGIEGIEFMTSVSRAEDSQITITFRLTRDVDAAANDVRDRVARVRQTLPDEIDEPVIAKVEADAEPIIYLAFSSDRHSPLDVTDFADRIVKARLQTLDGVADVPIYGERRYAMRIWLDRARLAAYSLTPQDVEDALRAQNVEVPAGRIESTEREFTVLTQTDLRTPEQFDNIILNRADGYLVRLKDVARTEIGAEDERIIARFNGRSAVAMGVVKQSVANPLDVSKGVSEALPGIIDSLPEGMQVDIAYDSSTFIDRSITEVFKTIGEAVVLVLIIIFLFLRSFRATIIPVVTIPVSLIGAFALMYLFGFSVNTLTMLAFVLAIGLVVDDAIVMLENIHRHVEEGMPPMRAAFRGVREIGFAVLAMTLTLAAVFAPIGFTEGRTGRLFSEFALTLAGAVLISGFVALTLSPMMCSVLLKEHEKHGRLYNLFESALTGMTNGYRALLGGVLKVRFLVVIVMLATAGLGAWLYMGLKSELAPYEDRGLVLAIGIASEGSTIENTDASMKRIEGFLAEVPEAARYFMVIGFPVVSQAISFLGLTDWSERERSSFDIAQELGPKMFSVPGVLAFPITPPSLGSGGISSNPVEVVIQTTRSYEELQVITDAIMAEARTNPNLVNLDTDLKLNKPELKVTVDRDKTADVGVPVEIIGRTLETMLGGRQVTRYKRGSEQYDVIVQVDDVERNNPRDVTSIFVRGDGDTMIQLSNLVQVSEGVAPRELNHFDKLRAVTISAGLAPGYSLGEALPYMEGIIQRIAPDVQIDFKGESREFYKSSTSIYFVFMLALGFIYLVLAAQFESFVDPFIIILSVPLAMTGALLALTLTGGTLNIYSQIGLVTLVGLITKHGILIVEFANQLRDQGKDKRAAVIEAATLRLRPILMTTGAMVLGAVPLAIATGAGAESRQQIGWVIVGGMLLGTLLTLFVVPTAYTLLALKRRSHAAVEQEHRLAGAYAAGE
jgi:multidrug efflux pump